MSSCSRTVEGDRHHVALDDSQSRACGLFGLRQWVPVRRSAAGPDAVGEFTGLGAGRWHITVEGTRQTARGNVAVRRTFEIDVDGEQDRTLDVDFRE
jgi:hypothetical protein